MTPQERLAKAMQRISAIVAKLKNGEGLQDIRFDSEAFNLSMDIFVQPKERPRKGRGGSHHYTPEATRKFEKTVADAAEARMIELGLIAFYRPVAVHLEIRDEFPEAWSPWHRLLAMYGMHYEVHHGEWTIKRKRY